MKKRDKDFARFERAIDRMLLVDDRQVTMVRYRWEFLRRDLEYIKAYQNNESPEPFDIKRMIDPKLSFADLLFQESAASGGKGMQVGVSPDGQIGIVGFNEKAIKRAAWLLGCDEALGHTWKNDHLLDIHIDFESAGSIDALKKELSRLVEFYWYYYQLNRSKDKGGLKGFDEILKVGDIKTENPEMTFKEVASIVYPEEDESPESREKRAQRRFKQYKKLVNGGWREIKIL